MTVNIWNSDMWTAVEEMNMEAILAVMNTTWVIMKIKSEKIQACTAVQAWIFITTQLQGLLSY